MRILWTFLGDFWLCLGEIVFLKEFVKFREMRNAEDLI